MHVTHHDSSHRVEAGVGKGNVAGHHTARASLQGRWDFAVVVVPRRAKYTQSGTKTVFVTALCTAFTILHVNLVVLGPDAAAHVASLAVGVDGAVAVAAALRSVGGAALVLHIGLQGRAAGHLGPVVHKRGRGGAKHGAGLHADLKLRARQAANTSKC